MKLRKVDDHLACNVLCRCHSQKQYRECCKPFHLGERPETALELMRSRYAAYALNLPDYIIKTTHPLNSQYEQNVVVWKKNLSNFSKNTEFRNLTILDFIELDEAHATVEFEASLYQQKRNISFKELSYFERVEGWWLYLRAKF